MTILEQQVYERLGHAMRQIPELMVEMMKDLGRAANALESISNQLKIAEARCNRVTVKKGK